MNKGTSGLRKISFISSALFFALFTFCCKKQTTPIEEEPENTFAKKEMLVNIADNVVLPAYEDLKAAMDAVNASYLAFTTTPSTANLIVLQNKFNEAYLKYQRVAVTAFGPGEDEGIRTNFNIFPTDTIQIRKNIVSGTYNLDAASNVAAKGFPALDFLFYGNSKNLNEVIDLFSNASRKKYTTDLLADMNGKISVIISEWNNPYRNTFVNSLGTDVGSSIGFLVNQINLELDNLKNAKIGIPLGLKSDGVIRPADSEAFYSGESKTNAIETLNAIEKIYKGKSNDGSDRLGFDDYLDHLGIKRGDKSLASAINDQFSMARQKLQNIGGSVSDRVKTNPTEVEAAHTELVKLLVLLKTDMPSSLGVVITYQDGDGD